VPAALAADARFHAPDGRALTTSELLASASGLPIVLAFFKTSCPTCKFTWPFLERLHHAYGGSAARVIGVAQDPEPDARAFYAEFGDATFELLLDPPPYAASNAFDVESVPHVTLLAPDGSVDVGFSGWSRAGFEALGAAVAARAGLSPVPLIGAGEEVPVLRPG
jgi:thiol-disulfide isomerase/thioredoxin